MEKIVLNNNTEVIFKQVKNTPRIALTCFVNIDRTEEIPGTYSLLNRLFSQGTKQRTAEQIAYEIERNGLDIYSDMKSDYWKFSLLCLNEDFEKAVELLSDMMLNSTFENFEKEKIKLKGETIAMLDSPTYRAKDGFVRNLYANHQYGHTGSLILENLDNLTKDALKSAYDEVFVSGRKVFSVVGDFDNNEIKTVLEKYFPNLKSELPKTQIEPAKLSDKKIVKLVKKDANQAQIFQGWFVPGLKSEDSAALSVMNTILGSSGLSSRLFLELRDKKGLAYTVRSSYTKGRSNGDFQVYIATEPKNIKVSLDGFKVEIDKLKNELVSEKELFDAKNNIVGKVQFVTETNIQQASTMAAYELDGVGYDYLPTWIEQIQAVSAADIQRVANRYFGEDYVLTILAPEEDMKEV